LLYLALIKEEILKLTPLDIKKQEFRKELRGYDKTEVNNFLSLIAEEMESLARENADLLEKLSTQHIKLDEYKNLEKSLQDTLIMAQKTTEEVRKNAIRESDLRVKKSKVEAQKILQESIMEKENIETEIQRLSRQAENIEAISIFKHEVTDDKTEKGEEMEAGKKGDRKEQEELFNNKNENIDLFTVEKKDKQIREEEDDDLEL
jgi:cell division initiation protein